MKSGFFFLKNTDVIISFIIDQSISSAIISRMNNKDSDSTQAKLIIAIHYVESVISLEFGLRHNFMWTEA